MIKLIVYEEGKEVLYMFEQEIFKRTSIDFNKLMEYGFKKEKDFYSYSALFMNDFRADVYIDEEGHVSGKIYDLAMEEEYSNFRVASQQGEFVNKVREEYKNILVSIVEHCCEKKYFITPQANRIANKIISIYQDEPYFAWESSPGFGVFRNSLNEKWYGLLYNIDKSKLDKKATGEVEAINVKIDSTKIEQLVKKKGFYPAYHMNKKNWITILLDDSLEDAIIMEYIKESHSYTCTSHEWIVPANPKYYDVINYFEHQDEILWKQSISMQVGDIIYLYVAQPYSAILYKCEVLEKDIPYDYQDENLNMSRVMKLKVLSKYGKEKYPFSLLNTYGIKSIRGARKVPKNLSKLLNEK